MLRDENNLKDSGKDIKDSVSPAPAPYQAEGFGFGGYTKTHKLITALYMVTDIIDKDEPMRIKLRTLGTEILMDTHIANKDYSGVRASVMLDKVKSLMSFLDIAGTVNIISEMNFRILKKEFTELKQAISDFIQKTNLPNKDVNLVEFFNEENAVENIPEAKPKPLFKHIHTEHNYRPIRHSTLRVGIQKGGTLLNALKSITVSDKKKTDAKSIGHNFEVLKKQRREDIVNVIKVIGGGATIKDIKDKLHAFPGQAGSLDTHSEKTLQRELVSMVTDGVLKKEGTKRWSKYFIK
jgi:hypothetical protein